VFALGIKRVEGVFEFGKHLIEWCYRLQRYEKTSTVAPRKHLKTTTLLGYIAWNLYNLEFIDSAYDENLFLSYKEDLAAYHLKRLKRYIKALPEYFGDLQELTNAESILHYTKAGKEFICEPEGIISFKRGRHPHRVYCDDILRDPQVKLDISQIDKITTIFLEQVMSMPKEGGGEVHLVGTPQDENDLFKVLEKLGDFDCKRYKAVIDWNKGITLWPEVFSIERCKHIRDKEIGPKAFMGEFQCQPVRSEDAYFRPAEIETITNSRLKRFDLLRLPKVWHKECYGGFDLGKKRHPSHLAIFADVKGQLKQVASIWFDGWDYTKQLEYVKELIEVLNIQKLYYDATRAEFEGFKERGELPAQMEGLNFTTKLKYQMAVEFEKKVKNKEIELIKDDRQIRQILAVDNDLKALETKEGHGDSFFSVCLAIKAYQEGKGELIWDL